MQQLTLTTLLLARFTVCGDFLLVIPRLFAKFFLILSACDHAWAASLGFSVLNPGIPTRVFLGQDFRGLLAHVLLQEHDITSTVVLASSDVSFTYDLL